MILAGMNIARLNFSHGEFSSHNAVIDNIRSAAEAAGRRVAIMADLSGPKMRIGQLEPEPIELKSGDSFTLTAEDIVGNSQRVSMSFPRLPQVVKPGDKLFLNDGFIQLEVPIERMAIIQKHLMEKANLKGKPVITATQVLESMTEHRLPTRAEATDVANAILDGTDCVMLSGESAMGKYPVEAAAMLAKIAASIEPHRPTYPIEEALRKIDRKRDFTLQELIALSVETTLRYVTPTTIVVPTRSGKTTRDIARFRQPVYVTAVSSQERTCQHLLFSYGVLPVYAKEHPKDWKPYVKKWLDSNSFEGNLVILTEGPSSRHPDVNNRMEILDLDRV
jgi:pyruvate kinase